MLLSKNVDFVQLQFRLEDRMKELGEHLRRAQKAKSCVRLPSGGGGRDSELELYNVVSKHIWFNKNDKAAPARLSEKDTALIEKPSVVPVILATIVSASISNRSHKVLTMSFSYR